MWTALMNAAGATRDVICYSMVSCLLTRAA
jgi:hypothetical protein